jgi:hypothetical protein
MEQHLIHLEELYFRFEENTDIMHDEMRLIEQATHHGMMYWNRDVAYLEGFVTYDINTAYPFCLLQHDLRIPKSAAVPIDYVGNLLQSPVLIKQLVDKGKLIVARVKLLGDNTWGFKNGVYTSYHFLAFHLLGVAFEVVADEAFMYDKSKKAHDIYHVVVERFIDAKKQRNKTTKRILNLWWGMSCDSRRVTKKHADPDVSDILADPDVEVLEATTKTFSYIRRSEGCCKYRMARMKPFILGYCVWMLSKQIAKMIKAGGIVARVHTDYICCNADRSLFKLSDEFCEYKIEKEHVAGSRYENVSRLVVSNSDVVISSLNDDQFLGEI